MITDTIMILYITQCIETKTPYFHTYTDLGKSSDSETARAATTYHSYGRKR